MALLSWLPAPLDAATLQALGAEHGIVPAADAQRLLDSLAAEQQAQSRREAWLAQARQEAQALRDEGQAAAQALLAQAQEQVQQQVAQACAQAREAAHAEALAEWHQRQADAAAAQAGQVRALHAQLAQVVTLAVEKIVGSQDRAALFTRALQQVQELARQAGALTLRVCPEDAAAAQASVATLQLPDAGMQVSVQADTALAPGSCRFETGAGMVDASLSTQLQALQAAMARAVARALAGSEAEEAGA